MPFTNNLSNRLTQRLSAQSDLDSKGPQHPDELLHSNIEASVEVSEIVV